MRAHGAAETAGKSSTTIHNAAEKSWEMRTEDVLKHGFGQVRVPLVCDRVNRENKLPLSALVLRHRLA